MTLFDFLRVLRERWVVILACLGLGLVGALAATAAAPREYEAQTSLFIPARVIANDASSVYDGTLLSQQRIASYASCSSATA